MLETLCEKTKIFPDADAVLRAFYASGKRHLFITGGRGVGKSTLLSALTAGKGYPGITTAAQPKTAVTMTDNQTGQQATIGIYDPTLPGAERKMRPTPDGFSGFGTALLRRCADAPGDFVTVDEIGYLELSCRAYMDALGALMERKRLLAVIRQDVLSETALLPRDGVFVLALDRPYGNAGCVIMASGMGVRFGGNKLMADFGGAPMIACALDATEGIFARRVVVTRHADVAEYCSQRGVSVLLHDLPHRSDTVRLGLEAVGAGLDACMFCPGDQPLLKKHTVAALAMAAAGDQASIFRAAFAETVGAPVIFPAWTFPMLLTLPEGKGGGYVMKRYPASVKRVCAQDAAELADADTRETLQQLEKLL